MKLVFTQSIFLFKGFILVADENISIGGFNWSDCFEEHLGEGQYTSQFLVCGHISLFCSDSQRSGRRSIETPQCDLYLGR